MPHRRDLMLVASAVLAGLARTARAADLMDDLGSGARTLRVGTDATFPPFEQMSASGERSGFDIDLVNAVARHAGIRKVEFRQVPYGQLVPALLAGQIDLAASAIPVTPEGAKAVDFSIAYFTGGLCAILRPDDDTVGKPADLNGKTVAVEAATRSVAFVRQNVPGAALRITQTSEQMFYSLQSRQADVVVTGLGAARFYIKMHGGAKLAPFMLTQERYGLAVRKTDTALLLAANAALAAFQADGTMKALNAKWFG